MTNIIPHNHKYHALAVVHDHDRLGWQSFLEGRISTIMVQEMHYHQQIGPKGLLTTASELPTANGSTVMTSITTPSKGAYLLNTKKYWMKWKD